MEEKISRVGSNRVTLALFIKPCTIINKSDPQIETGEMLSPGDKIQYDAKMKSLRPSVSLRTADNQTYPDSNRRIDGWLRLGMGNPVGSAVVVASS